MQQHIAQEHGLRRRAVLRSLAAAGFAAGCASPGGGPGSPSAIDVHCHVFNARDLPISGFVDHVILHDGQTSPAWVLDLLESILRGGAPTADEELAMLKGPPRPPPSAAEERDYARGRVEQGADQLLRALRQPRALSATGGRRFRAPEQDLVNALRAVARKSPAADPTSGGAMQPFTAAPDGLPTPAQVAAGAEASGDDVWGILRLGGMLTRPRHMSLDALALLPDRDGADVQLFAPALIDFGYWLRESQGPTPLAKQIELMRALSLRRSFRPFATHGWVSFCPWRQMAEPSQMTMVRDAIREHGFLGVKIYPLMGFAPYGNAEIAAQNPLIYDAQLRKIRNFGARLDAALRELYDFCLEKDVPIMAHCSHSQYPNPDAAMLGSPDGWASAIETAGLAKLRLSLAHFGGLWHLSPHSPSPDLGWTRQAVNLLADGRYPNIYADLGDYDMILDRDTQEQADDMAVLGQVNGFLAALPAAQQARARTRIMYGSDWVFLHRALGSGQYYPRMRNLLAGRLGLDRNGFLGGHAARFLGLARDADGTRPETRQRLDAFYRANGLDITFLNRFDPAGLGS